MIKPDKRDVAHIFRDRLERLVARSGLKQSTFAAQSGIDRSALSQLLSGDTTRLPRAETLIGIATQNGVSLDWLLGVSADEGVSAAIAPAFELEDVQGTSSDTVLARWHTEAAGTKIRYVPASIPDLMRTEAVIEHELRETRRPVTDQLDEAETRIAWNRRPETDMEICMTFQALDGLAQGSGIWDGLADGERRGQLRHMAQLADELYPGVRLYLFDGRDHFTAPYTVFGPKRAAIYMGDMYVVLNTRDAVSALTLHFDRLVRAARIQAHEVAAWLTARADAIA